MNKSSISLSATAAYKRKYNINTTAGTCTALSAAELASLNAGSGYNGFIAATDAYGYATVVYFVDAL